MNVYFCLQSCAVGSLISIVWRQCGVNLTNVLLVSVYIIARCNCCIDYYHPEILRSDRQISEEMQHFIHDLQVVQYGLCGPENGLLSVLIFHHWPFMTIFWLPKLCSMYFFFIIVSYIRLGIKKQEVLL